MINGKNISSFPKHWDVRPFSELVTDSTAGNHKIPTGNYLSSGSLPVIDQGQQLIGGYTSDSKLRAGVELPAIIFGDHTRVFKFIDFDFAIGADGAKILEPKVGVELDKKFLFHYLNNIFIESAGYSRHFKFLKEMYVPLPPLEEQKRIAAILDKADAIRRKRQQAIKLADDFLRSVFLEMFGDPVTNPKGWEVTCFGNAIEVLTDYHANGSYESLKAIVELKDKPDFAYMVRTTDLEKKSYVEGVKYISEEAYNFLQKSKVYGGELIINKIGSAGEVYLMPYLERPVSLAMNQFLLRCKKGESNVFYYHQFKTKGGDMEIKSRIQGAVTKTITKDAVPQLNLNCVSSCSVNLSLNKLTSNF